MHALKICLPGINQTLAYRKFETIFPGYGIGRGYADFLSLNALQANPHFIAMVGLIDNPPQ